MRSKRVTKLLACVLTMSMCTTPVFAFSADDAVTEVGAGESNITTDFGTAGATVKVTVPTKTSLKVNPFYNRTASGTVSGSQVATRDIKIVNKSYTADVGTVSGQRGVPVIVTAKATITPKADSKVNPIYDKSAATTADSDVFSADSDEKNIFLQLLSGNLTSVSSSATYPSSGTAKAIVTEKGSRIKFAVAAPTSVSNNGQVSDTAAGKGAMAILGEATVNADWATDDLSVGITYNIKASDTSVNDTPMPSVTVTQSSNKAVYVTVPQSAYGKAEVESLCFKDPENNAYGLYDVNFEGAGVTAEVKANKDIEIVLDKDQEIVAGMMADFDNKAQEVLVKLSDGRVCVATVTATK